MVSKRARNQFAVPLYLITTVSFLAAGQIAYADQSVREILKRVKSETYKMKEPVGRMLTLAPLAAAFARAGDLSAATRTVLKIPVSFRAVGADDVMQYQLKVGDIAGAQKIAASFSGNSEEKQWTLYKLAAASAGAHNWKLADEALRGLTGERWRSLALREVAEAKAKSGDLTGALSMIGQIPYGRDRVAVHAAVAAYHQLHLHTVAANQALKDAVAEAVSVPEDWGRPLAFIAVAEEYRRIGDIASARATLEQALANQKRISNQMYRMASLTDIAEEFAKIGDVDRAILLANMQPAGKDRDWAYRNIAPSMVERNSAKAITIIQRIQDRTTRLSAFRATATAQARQGRFAEAEHTCRFIVNDRDKLDSTHSNIAIITARSGRAEEALELVRRMKSGIMRARPLTAACRSLARNGKTQQALQATTHASSMEERTQALVGVAEGIMDREGRYAVLKTEGF